MTEPYLLVEVRLSPHLDVDVEKHFWAGLTLVWMAQMRSIMSIGITGLTTLLNRMNPDGFSGPGPCLDDKGWWGRRLFILAMSEFRGKT